MQLHALETRHAASLVPVLPACAQPVQWELNLPCQCKLQDFVRVSISSK